MLLSATTITEKSRNIFKINFIIIRKTVLSKIDRANKIGRGKA